MSPIRTYVDSSVLIAAVQAQDPAHKPARAILADPNRVFVSSAFLRLEVIPKTISSPGNGREALYYQNFFYMVAEWATDLDKIVSNAIIQMSQANIKSLDALHIGAAILLNADELVTTESQNNRIMRAIGIRVISIQPPLQPISPTT
jgi:predicted nucleic acid-binding protein